MVQPLESITHPVSVGSGLCIVMTTMMGFLVLRTRSTYNAIISHPTLNSIKVITSTYHLKIKFPTKAGVGEVCGEQVLALEYYVQELHQGERNVKMTESLIKKKPVVNLVLPPPIEEKAPEVETRDESALK